MHQKNRIQAGGLWLLAFTLIVGMMAVPSFASIKLKFNEEKTYVQEVSIKGDLRLRQENVDEEEGQGIDRQRQRYRLRVGVDVKLPNKLAIKTRFATSNDQDQVSTNQTADSNAQPKSFWVDRAYLEWKPWEVTRFTGGKVNNPFWSAYSSDIMWDTDYNPEGLTESFNGMGAGIGWFLNFGQFALEERKPSTRDAYLFSNQGGAEIKLPADSRIKVGVAFHEAINISSSTPYNNDIGGYQSLNSNSDTNGFSILELTAALTSWVAGIPVAVEGSWVKNNQAPKIDLKGDGQMKAYDSGYQAGLRVGKAKTKGKGEVAYFYKSVEKDAVMDGIADSDLPHGTNSKGHIVWAAYSITDFVKVQIKHFNAELKDVAPNTSREPEKKTQFDLITKF
jgi:hypothetical protein